MAGRRRVRWIVFLDGPLAGKRETTSIIPPGQTTVEASHGTPGQTGLGETRDIHEYKLIHNPDLKGYTATWIRFVRTVPLSGGPSNVPGPLSPNLPLTH